MQTFDRTLFSAPEGVTHFGIGAPDETILHQLRDATLEAARHRFAQDESPQLMQYGPTRGDGEFIDALAQFLTQQYQSGFVRQDELMLTAGASQALQMATTYFFNSGDTIFVEDPTYFLALEVFRDLNMNIVPVPQDADGLQVDLLEGMLRAGQAGAGGKRAGFKAMVYVGLPELVLPARENGGRAADPPRAHALPAGTPSRTTTTRPRYRCRPTAARSWWSSPMHTSCWC
jgi:DNA-binding transcriptional MocR family regulator